MCDVTPPAAPRKPRKPRGLTPAQKRILRMIESSGWLRSEHQKDGHTNFFLDSGKPISSRSISTLIRLGKLKPCEDGLFPEMTQSYVAVP